jgi:transmembrane sensor
MSNISQLHQKQQIQEQASLWISRLDRSLSPKETQQLSQWIAQTPKHHEALLEMAKHWDDLTVLNQISTMFPLARKENPTSTAWARAAIAASFIFMALISGNLMYNGKIFSLTSQNQQANNQTYHTNIGEQANFMMPDGTKIRLNTNSIVQIKYTPTHRQISLLQGEVSFDVAKDKKRPFTVTAGSQSFTALGTVFNVQKSNDKAIELVVTEGRVLITNANESIEKISEIIALKSKNLLLGVLVHSGEKALIIKDVKAPVIKIPLEQLQRDLAWQQGMLIFEGEPLDQALMEVERYTSIKFSIIDPKLVNLKVAGYFKAGDIDGLLASLNSNFNIVTNRNNDNVIELTSGH